jgi:hypothetical protein
VDLKNPFSIFATLFVEPPSTTAIRNSRDAFAQLGAMSFWNRDYFEDTGFDADKAANKFNKRTLLKVFGLAQILHKEQPLTVRSAFYRAVSAGLFPDTSDPHYNACGNIILKLRRLELIPWEFIVDSTRRRLKPSSWSGLADFAETVAHAYRKDLWERQPEYIEFFVEKDAMAGVIEPVTREFDVHLNVIRGQVSETQVHEIGEEWSRIDKPITGYYMGDHDPSGLNIEKVLRGKLETYSGVSFNWVRLGVTFDDFRNPELLGFPVKRKGPRGAWEPYLQQYGDRCVEIDAIPASEIRDRVRSAIMVHVDAYGTGTTFRTNRTFCNGDYAGSRSGGGARMSESTLEKRARRLADSMGLRIEKSRTRKHFHGNDKGGYMIIDNYRNEIKAGGDYDLDLKAVMEFLLAQ